MFYSIDGNIVRLEGGFPQRKVNTLTFQVDGSQFPKSYYSDPTLNNLSTFDLLFNEPENIIINYGDGNQATFNSVYDSDSSKWLIQFGSNDLETTHRNPRYFYQDENTGDRLVTITFTKPSALYSVDLTLVKIKGTFPFEIKDFKGVENLNLYYTRDLDDFPFDLTGSGIKILTFRQSFSTKRSFIPDSIFDLPLEEFSTHSTFNLSNPVSSNFFKINQFKSTLIYLNISDCQIDYSLIELEELINLKVLKDTNNPYNEIPSYISKLQNLEELYFGYTGYTFPNNNWIDFSELSKLKILELRGDNLKINEVHLYWTGLKSLNNIRYIERFVTSNSRFNEFINSFYTLCTNEAYLDTSTPTAQADEYTNKFRDISWGHSSLAFTGTKQAPAGYVQGSSNGTPTSEGEKVYVLQNQYGHTITHA